MAELTEKTKEVATKRKVGLGVMGWLVILLLFLAVAWALLAVNKSTDGVLAAVNDTRKDLEKKIKDVEGKVKTLASLSDLNTLTARFDEHEKNKKIHQEHSVQRKAPAGNKNKPDALDRAMGKQKAYVPPPVRGSTQEPVRSAGNVQHNEHNTDDLAMRIAEACAPRGIIPNERGGWRCAEEALLPARQEVKERYSEAYVSPQRQYYGMREQESSYSWSQAAKAGGVGCVVGALVDGGAGCARVLVGAVAGDFVDQKVVKNDSHIGAMVGGVIGAGASWQYRHQPAPQGALVGGAGGPVGMAP